MKRVTAAELNFDALTRLELERDTSCAVQADAYLQAHRHFLFRPSCGSVRAAEEHWHHLEQLADVSDSIDAII
jgi:hypothetical protein